MTDKAPVPNREVADRIGLSEAGVSRIRRGNRRPAPITMRAIEREYKWDMHDQFSFGKPTAYSERFERILNRDYEKRRNAKRDQHLR